MTGTTSSKSITAGIVLSYILLVLGMISLAFDHTRDSSDGSAIAVVSSHSPAPPESPDAISAPSDQGGTSSPEVANDAFHLDDAAEPHGQTPRAGFDSSDIESALARIDLDLDQGLVLGPDTLSALEFGISLLPKGLSSLELQELREMIQGIVPGPSGMQLADLVISYYLLKEEEAAAPPARDFFDSNRKKAEMSALRERYLGKETADRLFADPDAEERTHSDPALSSDESETYALAPDESNPESASLDIDSAQLTAYLSDVDDADRAHTLYVDQQVRSIRSNGGSEDEVFEFRASEFGRDAAESMSAFEAIARDWRERYERYAEEKAFIVDARMGSEEERQAIERLLAKHYDVDQIDAARAYDEAQSRVGP